MKILCGPEKNIKFYEPQERWEKTVNRILNGLKKAGACHL